MPAFTLRVSGRGASCCRESVAVPSLLEFECSVSIALLFIAPTNHLTAAVAFVIVSCLVSSFPTCQDRYV